jgi:hypothetical protein
MKKIIHNLVLFAGISFTGITLLSSCSKENNAMTSTTAAYYFTHNTVNQELVIQSATDDGTDITANFNGIAFLLTDTATFAGTVDAHNDLLNVHGTWTIDDAYDKITFSFPTPPLSTLSFLNKQWQYIDRNSETINLRAANGESDEVHFIRR